MIISSVLSVEIQRNCCFEKLSAYHGHPVLARKLDLEAPPLVLGLGEEVAQLFVVDLEDAQGQGEHLLAGNAVKTTPMRRAGVPRPR